MNHLFRIILLFFLFMQSCTVYHKTPLSIEKARDKGHVKLIHNSGAEYKFANLILKDSVYMGMNRKFSRSINPDRFSAIYLKDKKKSKKRTILTTVGVMVGVGAAIFVPWYYSNAFR